MNNIQTAARTVTAGPSGRQWRNAVAGMDDEQDNSPVPLLRAIGNAEGGIETASLDGVVERVTFRNEANGYTIAKFKIKGQRKQVTVAGNLPAVHAGQTLHLEGKWVNHNQYGKQFQVLKLSSVLPGSAAGLKKYLSSGLIKGVSARLAEQLVDKFGLDTLEKLDTLSASGLANEVAISENRAQAIIQAWKVHNEHRTAFDFLQTQRLSSAQMKRIIKQYGSATLSIIRTSPYRLIEDITGITFEQAEQLAQDVALPIDTPQRIKAGLKHILNNETNNGHTCVPRERLVDEATTLLRLRREKVEEALEDLAANGEIVVEVMDGKTVVFLETLYRAELFVTSTLLTLQNGDHDRLAEFQQDNWPEVFNYLREIDPQLGLLTQRQQEAVRLALTNKVTILTGGPGTGKTTTLRALITLLQSRDMSVVLAAPTGRAARRLTEATGAPARTIHRLLDLRPSPGGEFQHTAVLDADIVIIDEASMMDLLLAEALLHSIPPGTHLLLVGDPDQLPSVGAGEVLYDLLASKAIPTVRLETIFRQGENSGIAANAHLINAGELPRLKGFKDFYYLAATRAEECADLVVDLASRRLPTHYGFDPIEDIQVIAPMYSGPAGVAALNSRLQECLNPPSAAKSERRFGDHVFREGDKVMQVVNDYERQVFNGDIGRIVQISLEEQQVRVLFDNEWPAVYSLSELDELTHAYALSVHKSQGSEYPVVIMPLMKAHHRMLQRNLVYTGISRARKLVVLVGETEALSKAISNNTAGHRLTGLAKRLVS